MGRYCQINGCNTNCSKTNKSMFGFPLKNKNLLKKWLDNIPGDVNVTNSTGICEDHFEKHLLFVKDTTKHGRTRKMLLKNAVPTIFEAYDPNFESKQSAKKKNSEKEDDVVDFEHTDNCRLCLKKFSKQKERLKINDLVDKRFKNITKMKLRKSTVYSKFVCVKCYRNLKYFSIFKDDLIKNQLKLYQYLEALEDFDEYKDDVPLEMEVLDTGPDEVVEEIIEEISYDEYVNDILEDDSKDENEVENEDQNDYDNDQYIEELDDENSVEMKYEDQQDDRHQVLFELEIENLAVKEEFENEAKETITVLEPLYANSTEVKEEKNEMQEVFSIYDLPKWDDVTDNSQMNSSMETSVKSSKKKTSMKKKYQKKKSDECESDYRRPQVHIKYGSTLCPICGKTFSGGRACRVHVERTHLKIKRYTCDICGYRSYMKDHLKSHMTSHIKEKTIPCDQCDRVFNRLQCLRVHIKSAHSSERTHVCECGKSYKTHSALYTHMRYWHSDEKKFQCEICNYVAYDNNKLKDHRRIHSDKPELKCPECDEFFFTLVKLRLHKQAMHEEPKFTCEYCGHKFHLQSKLRIHVKSHLGVRDYKCPYCEMKYFKNSALNRHIMHYHMKLKLKCEIPGCTSQFARKETYKNHVLSHHKDIGDANVQMILTKIREMKQPTETSVFKLNNLRGH